MALPSDEFYKKLIEDTTIEEHTAREEARFEDDVVYHLLIRHGLHELRRTMLAEHKELYGRPQLTLAAYHLAVTCPVYFRAVKIAGVAEDLRLHRLFERFEKLKIASHWQDALAERPSEYEYSGLVFSFPYLKSVKLRDGRGGALVLHNYQGYDGDVAGMRLTTREVTGDPLHIETLQRLLLVLEDGGWQSAYL